jgi:hypothetical protein
MTSWSAVAVILVKHTQTHTHEYLHNQAHSQNCEKQLLASSCLSVRPSTWNNSAPLDGFSWGLISRVFFKNLWRKLRFHSILTRITSSLHEDLCKFLIISHWILHTMRNISDKCCRENQNTRFMFNKFFPPKNGAVYETMQKNMVQPDTPQTTV